MSDEQDSGQSQTVKALLGLRDLVLSGELRPGDRVSELAMVKLLGVSRTPLRAALLRLEGEGLLAALPNGGYTAKHFTEQDVFAAIEVRGALEGLAARFAAERHLSANELAPIKAILAETDHFIEQTKDDADAFAGYVDLNARFHETLAALSGTSVIEAQIARACAHPFASPNGFVEMQAHMAETRLILQIAQDHHHCVVDAIEAGEGGRAEALMREHARLAHRNLRAALRSQKTAELMPGAALIRR